MQVGVRGRFVNDFKPYGGGNDLATAVVEKSSQVRRRAPRRAGGLLARAGQLLLLAYVCLLPSKQSFFSVLHQI
jgi:hypothetical protein